MVHLVEAEYWRLSGCNDSRTAEQFKHSRTTILRWCETEGWVEWATQRNSEDAEAMRHVALLSATEHSLEMDALIGVTRKLAVAKGAEIIGRLTDKSDVDPQEYGAFAKLVQTASAAGASKYGAAAVSIAIEGVPAPGNATADEVLALLARQGIIVDSKPIASA